MLKSATVLFALLTAGCASDGPQQPDPDFSGERVDVRVLRGGFVEFNGQRVPLEDCILRLRQRLRPMTDAQRHDLWVRLTVEPGDDPQVQRDHDRMLEELGYMGVGQIQVGS